MWHPLLRQSKLLTKQRYEEIVHILHSEKELNRKYQQLSSQYTLLTMDTVTYLQRKVDLSWKKKPSGRKKKQKSASQVSLGAQPAPNGYEQKQGETEQDGGDQEEEEEEPDDDHWSEEEVPEEQDGTASTHGRAPEWGLLVVPKLADLHTILLESHLQGGHRGAKTVFKAVSKQYYGITRQLVTAFIARCSYCLTQARSSLEGRTRIVAIQSDRYLHRCQVDCFFFKDESGAAPVTRTVLHYQDHWSKYSWLRHLPNKEGETVRHALWLIWNEFGVPKILQSDNGREFVNVDVEGLCREEHVAFIHGRPYHPQSQGSVERANAEAKKLLRVMYDSPSVDGSAMSFADKLSKVQRQMNQLDHRSIGTSSYKAVFNREPINKFDVDDEYVESLQSKLDPDRPEELQEDEPEPEGAAAAAAAAASSHHHDTRRRYASHEAEINATKRHYARKWLEHANKKAVDPDYAIGGLVSVQLYTVHTTAVKKRSIKRLHLSRQVCMVLKVSTTGRYLVAHSMGVIEHEFTADDMNPHPELFRPDALKVAPEALLAKYSNGAACDQDGGPISMQMLIHRLAPREPPPAQRGRPRKRARGE